MTTSQKAPTILTEASARRLTSEIRNAAVAADRLLVQAYRGRIWKALNYSSWADYCATELPGLRLLSVLPEERAEKWAEQVRAGLSQAAVADAAGVGKATVSRALQGKELPATATGIDGKVRSTRSTVPPRNGSRTRKTDRVVALIEAAGPRGLDVRQVQKVLRCQRNEASATLTRLHDARRVAYVAPVRRGLFGRYVAATR